MSKRKLNRLALTAKIQSASEEIISYSSYTSLEPPYTYIVLSSASVRYSKYIRRGFTRYNIYSIAASSLSTLIKEEERLKLE